MFRECIIEKFKSVDGKAEIPLLKGGTFKAELKDDGIEVSNLGTSPLLIWEVFDELEKLFEQQGFRVIKGDAMNFKLGESRLGTDSIEGRVAARVYGKTLGDSVFRRISPIVGILRWAGICKNAGKYLELIDA